MYFEDCGRIFLVLIFRIIATSDIVKGYIVRNDLSSNRTIENDDNIYIEHRVNAKDAALEAKRTDPNRLIGFGCEQCTQEEIIYCKSEHVVLDHCCCNRRYEEIFPYMEHVCYFNKNQTEPCQPVISDCAEYSRLVECCCHKYLAEKWKSYYSDSSSSSTSITENNWKFENLLLGQFALILLTFYLQL